MKKYVVGTRGSTLALTQTKWVLKELQNKNPEMTFELKVIETSGDQDKKTILSKVQNKDFFTDAIQQALLSEEIDLAVHSMKDLSSEMPETLLLLNPPKREDPRDVLILKKGITTLEELPKGATIATSSLRRRMLLKELRPDITCPAMRGNVDERIEKIKTQGLDGILLAAAGVKRLGRSEAIDVYLDETIFIPAPAQGILALQVHRERKDLIKKISKIQNAKATIQMKAERKFYALAENRYDSIGAFCQVNTDEITLYALLGKEGIYKKASFNATVGQEEMLAEKLFKKMEEGFDGA